MNAQDFCERMGFYLEPEAIDDRISVINVIDTRRRLYKSGVRNGTWRLQSRSLPFYLDRAYRDLMNLILDQVFQ